MATIAEVLFQNGSYPTRIDQSISITSQITTAIYTYSDGSKVYGAYAYATNTSADYLAAAYGLTTTPTPTPTPAPTPTPTPTLSGFAVSANGLLITYTNSGATLSGVTGTYSINGIASPLVLAAGGFTTTQIRTGNTVTITTTSTTPATTAVTAATVTNNSTVAPIPTAGSKTLTYATNGDTNGVFYYLGTARNTAAFSNPTISNSVSSLASSLGGTLTADVLSDRTDNKFSSSNTPGSWVTWDLKDTMSINKYTLTSVVGEADIIRSWVLEGTNTLATFDVTGINGAVWTAIDGRRSDATLTSAVLASSFTPSGSKLGYRYIRLRMTGLGANNSSLLILNEVEFYGILGVQPTPVADAAYSLVYSKLSPNTTVSNLNIVALPNVDQSMVISTFISVANFKEIRFIKTAIMKNGVWFVLDSNDAFSSMTRTDGLNLPSIPAMACLMASGTYSVFGNNPVAANSFNSRLTPSTNIADNVICSILKAPNGVDLIFRTSPDNVTFTEQATAKDALKDLTGIWLKVVKYLNQDGGSLTLPASAILNAEVIYV